MPGLVGFVSKMPREHAESQLAAMVASIRHESFYKTGTSIDPELGLYVGWTAREESACAAMPLRNETGDVTMVFSGEDFPEPASVAQLKAEGHEFDPQAPCSHLVHAYESRPGFFSELDGMFHGVVLDRRRKEAILFNDRYGMHRLYFHAAPEAFYFAVEAKAILAVRPELRSPDPQGLGEFVACSCTLDDRTIFKGIRVLPPASAWRFRNGSLERKDAYFDPKSWEEQEATDSDANYHDARDAFVTRLPRYFNGGNKIGLAMTGGLDTRAIMAWRKPESGTLPSYTYGGTFRDCQDVKLARKIAALCGQQHSVLNVGDEFLRKFDHYADRTIYLTEGCVDMSNSPDLYVSELARQIAPVKVVGTYGSEIVCQAVMFKPSSPPSGLFQNDFAAQIDSGAANYGRLLQQQNRVTFVAIRQSQWHHYGVFALEQTQVGVRPPFLANEFVKAAYRAPRVNGRPLDFRPRLIREGSAKLAGIRSDRGAGGDSRLAGMLARGFHEFTFKAEYAYDYGMPQWVANVDHRLSKLHLERLFLGRHKFAHFRHWYRTSLSDYVRHMLLDKRTLARPYVNKGGVEWIVNSHLSGRRNYTTAIHTLLTLECLHRRFFDSQ